MPMLSHADNTEDPVPQVLPPSAVSSNALRTQRLSPDEARAVIDLWQAEQVEQTGLTDRPAVPDVAEGLDLSVEDVQRLLAEVRTRRDAESRLLAHEQELAEIRLAEQHRTLAEQERKIAEIQRQRAELARTAANVQRQVEPQRVQAELPLPPVSQPRIHSTDTPINSVYRASYHAPPPHVYSPTPWERLGLMEILYGFLPGFIAVSVALLIVVLLILLMHLPPH